MTGSQANEFTLRRCGIKAQAVPRVCWEQLTCSGTSVIVGSMQTGREIVIGEWLGTGIHVISGAALWTYSGSAGYKTHSPGI